MDFDQALAYLLSLGHETLTIKLGLKNTETLLVALGAPQRNFQSVQIAGTNGKGSTAAFLDSVCRAAGIRTGLFTSPHLISITERIKVDGDPIPEPSFARLTSTVKAVAEELVARGELPGLPTYFEHVTAISLLAFREAKVDLAILETGLGGRLDSTTAVGAGIVAITPVSMDHQEYLGDTLAEIAAEKAAIIRPDVTAIIAPQKEAAFDVIINRCESVGIQPRLVEPRGNRVKPAATTIHFTAPATMTAGGRAVVSFQTESGKYEKIRLSLRGRHQIDNAATAIVSAEALAEKGFRISRDAIVHGLETANHPGRLELWEGSPQFLFDGAHNPAAAEALRNYLSEFINQPVTMIFGAMRDKALNEMMQTLFPQADKVILTMLDNPRAASNDEMFAALPREFDQANVWRTSTVAEALEAARNITPPSGIVCVTGSLHLIGEAQELLGASAP